MRKIVCLSILLLMQLLFSRNLVAQRDVDFWFVAPEVAQGHGDRPIYLRLSTVGTGGDVTITQPANIAFSPIIATIPADGMVSVDLTSRITMIENNPANTVLEYGLYLTSETPFSAYYEIAHQNNPDIYPLKGRNGLGNEFWIPGQNNWPNIYGEEVFDIVATENSTLVTITPTIAVVGHAAGVTYTITLNRGETYSCRAISTAASFTLSGTHVVSDKPIAITVTDDSVGPSSNYDIIGDQIVPVDFLGMEYVVVRGYAFNEDQNFETIFIVATEDNTALYFDGSLFPIATIDQGETYELEFLSETKYIISTEPIYVYHLSGIDNEFGGAIIPPVNCTGSLEVSFVRTSSSEFDLFMVTQTQFIGDFLLNGGTGYLTADKFYPVIGNALLSYTRLSSVPTSNLPVGNNIIQNSGGRFHIGILNDLGGSSEYGFFSDFTSLNLGPDILVCTDVEHMFDAGPYVDSYVWNTGSTDQTITVVDTGFYWVDVVDDLCELSDTVHLGWYEQIHSQLPVGPIQICSGDEAELDAGSGFVSYLWSTLETDQVIYVDASGIVWVDVVDALNGCTVRDSSSVVVKPRPSANPIHFK